MKINRRNFLISSGLTAAVGAVSTMAQSSTSVIGSEPSIIDLKNWEMVRRQFGSLSRAHIHMSFFFLAPPPRPVREAIERYRQAIDDNPFLFVEENILAMP